MRALAAYLKPYRKESILAPLFKLLEALFDLLVPLVVARMIDAGSGERTVFLCFAGLIAMAAVGLGCSVLAQYFAAKASVGFAGSLRQALFAPVERLPLQDCLGRVAAGQLAPYPPGVPVVAPGERIGKKELAYFRQIGYNNREVTVAAMP